MVAATASGQNITIAGDACIFTFRSGKLQVLLIQMKKTPFTGKWALPGGLVDTSERLESAARKFLRDQTGVGNVYVEQLYTFDDPNRDPRGRVARHGSRCDGDDRRVRGSRRPLTRPGGDAARR